MKPIKKMDVKNNLLIHSKAKLEFYEKINAGGSSGGRGEVVMNNESIKNSTTMECIKNTCNNVYKSPPELMELINVANELPQLKIWGELSKAVRILSEKTRPLVEIINQTQKAITDASPQLFNFMRDFKQAIEEGQRGLFAFEHNLLSSWNRFEEELKTQNRYFPNSEFMEMFEGLTKIVQGSTFRKGTILYRARTINYMDSDCGARDVICIAQKNWSNYDKQHGAGKIHNHWEYIENIPNDEWENDYSSKPSVFWGYNAEKSDAPHKSTTQGRINPVGISYLYAARDINTAIAETQPTNEQIISVAKIKTLKGLRLFTFDFHEAFRKTDVWSIPLNELENNVGMSYFELKVFFDVMSRSFSKPITENAGNYYATQYISEFIKKKGFDGIKYKSSLREGGYNIVLFDTSKDDNGKPKNYEILCSSLYRVSNVRIISKKVLPRKTQG